MTRGLLISRATKDKLHKKIAINDPTVSNLSIYKTYRNMYNSLVRASKKQYFTHSLKTHEKNPRKTWEILKEAIHNTKTTNKIDSIISNNLTLTNPTSVAEEFNNFSPILGSPYQIQLSTLSLSLMTLYPPTLTHPILT
jgi:hypothetical protein